MKSRLDEIVKLQNEAALEEEKKKVEETALKNKMLAEELKQQMALLHRKEEESEMLKAEEEKLRHNNEALMESVRFYLLQHQVSAKKLVIYFHKANINILVIFCIFCICKTCFNIDRQDNKGEEKLRIIIRFVNYH